jgi:hypothetical protein
MSMSSFRTSFIDGDTVDSLLDTAGIREMYQYIQTIDITS